MPASPRDPIAATLGTYVRLGAANVVVNRKVETGARVAEPGLENDRCLVTRRGLAGLAIWSAPILMSATAAPMASASESASGWTLLGVHPEAAAQPTQPGRRIIELEVFAGALYAGYGDYNANTGPIAINPFDLSSGTFLGNRQDAYTHQIAVYRPTAWGLVAPNIDPLQDIPLDPLDPNGGFSWTDDGGKTWNQAAVGPSYHVYDFSDQSSSGPWAVGASSASGSAAPTIWRRTGDESWQVSFQGDNDPTVANDRYYWLAVVGGLPYVQARGSAAVKPLRSFDPTSGTWLSVSEFSGELHASGNPQHVQVLGTQIVSASGAGLRIFSTETRSLRVVVMPNGLRVIDLYVRGSELFTLTQGAVFRSADGGVTFQQIVTVDAPAPTAIAVSDDMIYLGTAASRLLAHSMP